MDIVRIGRESDNDVVYHEGEVSRYHCELYCSNGRVFIRDLDSTNGTQVNGRNIASPVALKRNDTVVLGHKVKIDWFREWSNFYHYSIAMDDASETIRYDGRGEATVRHDAVPNSPQQYSENRAPIVDIPSSIHIHQQQEHAEVLKGGDDFKVPFKRNLGNNIGHHVGNTLGCIISIIIVAIFIAIVVAIVN